MHLLLVGLSHKTAPIEIRERLTFPAHRQEAALEELVGGDEVAEAVILSTCNRTEVYVVSASAEGGAEAVMGCFTDLCGLPREELGRYVYNADGQAAVRHLFRVVSSLDSMVVGEAQILGQCKDAYDAAFEHGSAGRILNKLFRQSFEVGKRVRTETSIGESAVSISYAAVELAKKVFSTLAGRTILIVGAGKMSELTARHLVSQGVASVLVANRTYERAVELAERFEGEPVAYEDLVRHIGAADIVISSTGAEGFVIGKDDVAAAVHGRRSPLFLIDIAVPRDIDPDVNELHNVFLYDIDDLSGVVESNMEERMHEARRAEVIIAEEVEAFEAWIESMEVVPTIAEIRAGAEAMRQEEYAKAVKRLSGLSEKELATIDALTQAIVGKMLHTPTAELKRAAADKDGYVYVEAARRLYGLDSEEEAARPVRSLRSLLGVRDKRKKDETGEQVGC
jgi:glutamyl-tRNA reductase